MNTKHLERRLSADIAAAACAGALVAPVITVIDRGIIENASGRRRLMDSIRSSFRELLFRPHRFILSRPFGLIFMLYSGTYITANTLDTAISTFSNRPSSTVTAGPAKFVSTSAANISLCLYKDSHFARLFGPVGAPPGRVPPVSLLLFAARDSMTVFASFNLPPLIAPVLPLNGTLDQYVSRSNAAQFMAPAAIQFLSTPMHLLGLDLYNRPGAGAVSWHARYVKVRENWLKSTLARMCRIIPAFGFGGIVNSGVRYRLMERISAP